MTSVHEASTAWRMPIAYAPGEADKAAGAGTAAAAQSTVQSTVQSTAGSTAGSTNEVSNITADDGFKFFGNDGPSFGDLIDVINPLQHIPVVGALYREITGDTLDPAPKVAGNTLYFGPIGALTSVVDVFVEETTGKDVGGHVMSVLDEDREENALAGRSAAPTDVGSGAQAPGSTGSTAGVDPITAWAAAEMGYRRAEALKQGFEPAKREYDSLIAAHAAPQEDPSLATAAMGSSPLAGSERMILDRPTAEPGRGPVELAAAVRPDGRMNDGPGPVDGPVTAGAAPVDDPVMAWAVAETALSQGTPASAKAFENASAAAAPAEGGGWFSSVMLDALDRYHPNPAAAVRPGTNDRARMN